MAADGAVTGETLRERVEAALREVADPIHARGCNYRHQVGETGECNSCTAWRIEHAVRAALAVPCGSCGEPAPYVITLRGRPVPACLRHLNHWRTPAADYTCPTRCVEQNHPGRGHHEWLDARALDAPEPDWREQVKQAARRADVPEWTSDAWIAAVPPAPEPAPGLEAVLAVLAAHYSIDYSRRADDGWSWVCMCGEVLADVNPTERGGSIAPTSPPHSPAPPSPRRD